jgi:flagellar L-ring protein precursor FlgH
MNNRTSKLTVIAMLTMAFCSASRGQNANQDPNAAPANAAAKHPAPPPVSAQDAAAMMRSTGGSLMQATMAAAADQGQAKLSDLSFFAVPDPEPKFMRKHDLVTIIVREESESKSEGTTDLKKQADMDAKVDAFINFSLKNFALKPNVGSTTPEIKLDGSRNFKGEATVDRSDSLTARITAEVVDVKPNGTLVLQARKRIKTDEEVQQFILTGICRAEDVLPDNTILSTQMYDLELNKSHKGAVRDTTKRGWVPKLLDAINPF